MKKTLKPKELFEWWWNYDAPWWAWLLAVVLCVVRFRFTLHF